LLASVSENQLRDDNQNVVIGDVIVERSHNCYFNAQEQSFNCSDWFRKTNCGEQLRMLF